MNWFLRHLIDDHVHLTRAQRKAVKQRVMERISAERGMNILRFAPGFLPLLMVPFRRSIRQGTGLWVWVMIEVLIVIIGLGLVYLLLSRAYRHHARMAIRDLGIANICPDCGYDLTGVEMGRCPECGAES